jgi:hypothetical protein
MKFPRMNAEQSLGVVIYKGNHKTPGSMAVTKEVFIDTTHKHYRGMFNERNFTRVDMSADIGCLSRCVGSTAYNCLHCEDDPDCWESCAGSGPEASTCINSCM